MSAMATLHPGSDRQFPLDKGAAELNRAFDVFGPPQLPMPYAPEQNLATEAWPLYKIFEGKNEYLEDMFSSMIMRTHNSWATKVILTPKRRETLNFSWSRKEWPRELPRATAPRGVPELVTYTVKQYYATMQRYQLGWELDSETLLTDEGQTIAAGYMISVSLAFVELMEQLVIKALLDAKMHYRVKLRREHAAYPSLGAMFAWSKELSFCLQKRHHAIEWLVDKVKGFMGDIVPTDIIMPAGMASAIANDTSKTRYLEWGAGNQSYATLGADAVAATVADLRHHVIRPYLNANRAPEDRLLRPITYGDFLAMHEVMDVCSRFEDYCSRSRNVMGFDLTHGPGRYVELDFLQKLRESGRWVLDDDGLGPLDPQHGILAENLNAERALAFDMFLYRNPDNGLYEVVSLAGHMEEAALPASAVRASALTFDARMRKALGPQRLAALANGLALRDRIYGKQLTVADFTFMAAVVDLAVAAERVDGNVYRGNIVGGPFLGAPGSVQELGKTAGLVFEGGNRLPAGFGSVAGLRTLALLATGNEDPSDPRAVAAAFSEALDVLFQYVSSVVISSHPAIDPRFVPAYFAADGLDGEEKSRADAITVFGTNLFDHNKVPLHVASGGGGGEGEGGEELGEGELPALEIAVEENENEANAAEVEAVQLLRRVVWKFAPPQLKKALSTPGYVKFAGLYAASPFGRAYAAASEKAGNRVRNGSFGAFAAQYFRRKMAELQGAGRERRTSRQALANALQRVVMAVQKKDNFTEANVLPTLDSWLKAEAGDEVIAAQAIPRDNVGISRLVVSHASFYTALRNNTVDGTLAESISRFWYAAFNNVATVQPRTQEAAVRDAAAKAAQKSIENSFLHSGARGTLPWHARGDAVAPVAASARYAGDLPAYEMPSYGASVFTSSAGGALHTNSNIARRYADAINRRDDPLKTAATLLVLLSPVTLSTFTRFHEHDISIPFDIVVARPHMLFQMWSVIILAAGPALGEMSFGMPDIQMGANAATKTFLINMTMYMLPLIKDDARCYVAENVAGVAYGGGAGFTAHTPETHREFRGNGTATASAYVYLEPARSTVNIMSPFDIRGRFDEDVFAGHLTPEAEAAARKPHHASWLYYNHFFGFGRDARHSSSLLDGDTFNDTNVVDNTVVHRGGHVVWDTQAGDLKHLIENEGHLGRLRPGLGDAVATGSSFMPLYDKPAF